jgi:hypothetical protein
MSAPNVWQAVEYAYAHEEVLADAQRRFALAAQHLFEPHAVELSASSAGKCVLDVWAYLHDRYDLPENRETELAKMDGGTLYGARIAALFAAGYEKIHPKATVEIETQVEHEGIPGHLDIVIRPGEAIADVWIVEVKTTFSTFPFAGPPDYHVIQAAKYALAEGAPGFSVFTLLPAAQRRKGEPARFHHQADFATADWQGRVAREYERLEKARFDTPPLADPQEAWRCTYCRFGACPQNPRHDPLALEEEFVL